MTLYFKLKITEYYKPREAGLICDETRRHRVTKTQGRKIVPGNNSKKTRAPCLPGDTTGHTKVKMIINDSIDERVTVQMNGGKAIISTINVIRKKAGDPLPGDSLPGKGIFVSRDQ